MSSYIAKFIQTKKIERRYARKFEGERRLPVVELQGQTIAAESENVNIHT
jgi:hypothetical protein